MKTSSSLSVGVIILLTLLSLGWLSKAQAQVDPIPFDLSVVAVIDRTLAPHATLPPTPNQCGFDPVSGHSGWILMVNLSEEAVLCQAETGELRRLPIIAAWTTYEDGVYRQPSLSPDGAWLLLGAYGDNRYDYYAVSTRTDAVVSLGAVPYDLFSSYPPDQLSWLSATQGVIINSTNSDSLWDTLYGFDVTAPNNLSVILDGYPYILTEPRARVEMLISGRWLSQMAGTSLGNGPCEFTMYDTAGLREYPLDADCQIETVLSGPEASCGIIRSDGEKLTVLRTVDATAGLSELISLDVTSATSEPTVLYRGEIDYMLQQAHGATLSALGADGQIADAVFQPCWLVDVRPFLRQDLLLTTDRGIHVIAADELLTTEYVQILATSPDKTRVLLSNGAIYDVVEDRRVANITGGVSIDHVTVEWFEDGRLIFTEYYDPVTDEQITIRFIE